MSATASAAPAAARHIPDTPTSPPTLPSSSSIRPTASSASLSSTAGAQVIEALPAPGQDSTVFVTSETDKSAIPSTDLLTHTNPHERRSHAQSVREVGNQATWSLSSCKPGFGVEQLRDHSVDTYWQSDGQLPHLVNIQFRRKTTVSDVAVYTDFKLDESYTPSKISVRCGTNFNDLQEIEVVDLQEPNGWVHIPLTDLNDRLVRTFMVQIAVIANHQQGRDTHLRQIKIHSSVEDRPVTTSEFAEWTTPECLQFVHIR
ncbi:hypothetical protein TCAL_11496 [Tigriopus californicus]|uniref:Anaphase-promoting complex subunit 10 n=1 Tax=Tigriopus californicus TaxID=6832 RepID=A0A553NE98_TIGCA|nr:anaphase-promoting complex subunit 10-like [Tigriopus californicus]TRY63773.1 hypothetical protein TCAL_11496 [Tigriopus californicus]|eukprot:TCALIF_11496-PA protein Name:"Similar to APC10 Anaphase-promoting complex subunit 10 (Drosophila melanogaster)" AED:0.45 eAED:0.45 QI:0/0/0/1/1/1/2/0/258